MTDNPRARRIPLRRKLLYSAATVLLLLLFAEVFLAVLGVKPAAQTRDLFVGFQEGAPLFVREGDDYVTNELKLSFFNKQRFAAKKAENGFRVFSLGGSTTFGHPFDTRPSYNSWLAARLEETHPKRKWEVVNCGGISYASYRLARIMRELVRYEPDLFIIYTGHNEFLEERTYGEVRRRSPALTRAIQWASHLRLFSLIHSAVERTRPRPEPPTVMSAEVDTILERGDGPESYHRDEPLRGSVLAHYRDALARMIGMARSAGAQVILVQPASNLRDFSPFKSEHRPVSEAERRSYDRLLQMAQSHLQEEDPDEALRLLAEAEKMDPVYAHGLWQFGRALLATGESETALAYFVRAKDEDVCPLRALSAINRAVADIGRQYDVPVIDFPRMLADKCRAEEGHAAVGLESFLDHVHPNLASHRLLGLALYEAMASLGIVDHVPLSAAQAEKLDRRIGDSLSPYDNVMALHTLAMTLSWAGKNEEALKITELALKGLPKNSEIVAQHGRILEKLGREDEALKRYQDAVQCDPNDSLALFRLASLLVKQGKYEIAAGHLRRAIELTPERAPTSVHVGMRLSLAGCLSELGDLEAAKAAAAEVLKIDPRSAAARRALADLSRRAD
ncbi:MAG: tetratricopeptide repeat protein [Planctomycetota bacterium]